jgi:hypothetical protein
MEFFAPKPNVADYFLLYRDYYENRQCTPWREVSSLSPRRRAYAWFWNPEKLVSKSLFDMIQSLGLESRETNTESQRLLQLSVPYLHLLSYVSNVHRWPTPLATQFMIMRRDSISAQADVIVVSSVHQIGTTNDSSTPEALNRDIAD